MRDLILKMSMSLDGFVAREDGPNTWMFGDDHEAKAWSADYLWNAGLHIMGSATFGGMAAHWPNATDSFAAPMNAIPKAVFSQQGTAVRDAATASASGAPDAVAGWAEARVMGGDLAEAVATLKAEAGKPLIAHGGIRFARSLIARNLVDQFVLLVAPVALGRGQALFADLPAPLPLRLVSAKAFPGGAVAQIYRPLAPHA